MNKKRSGKNQRSGFLFMVLILLILGLVLYIYRDNFSVLLNSRLSQSRQEHKKSDQKNEELSIIERIKKLEQFNQKKPDREKSPANAVEKEVVKIIPKNNPPANKAIDQAADKITDQVENKKQKPEPPVIISQSDESAAPQKIVPEKKPAAPPVQKETMPQNAPSKQILSKVYFNVIDTNQKLLLISRYRKVSKKLPLTESIQMLLKGPTSSEKSTQMISNIPAGTSLLSISIHNNIAYINFSQEFEFNHYGRESTQNQLKQIVYTATEFSNVYAVQFLIEGRKKNYLGGEGISIGRPLSRKDFS